MSRPDRHTYEFGPFRLNPAEGQLLRDGEPQSLTPKAFEALVLLVEKQGRLIEKEEMMAALWPDTFVEEANLAHHIWRLRKVLEDVNGGERYIETVPKRGYRFIATVKAVAANLDTIVEQHTITRLVAERTTEDATADSHLERQVSVRPPHRPIAVSARTALAVFFVVVLALTVAGYFILRRVTSSKAPVTDAPITTLAVLPFKPLTPESADTSLELGMADALITRLSNVKELTVRPTSAVIKYASPNGDLAGTGRELNVQAVLDGNVQRSADRIRVTLQLIRSADGKPLWAEHFDEKFTDIFALEDSLSEKVARALSLQLNGSENSRIHQRYTNNIEAYQAYLKGRYQMNQAAEGALKATASFEEAIQKDPNFALAYAGLADARSTLAFMGAGSERPADQITKSKAAATKALELDDSLAEVHTSLATVLLLYDWKWAEAEKEFKRAIELNPNLADAHHGYSEYLQAMTRWDEALAEIKRAQELDPLSLQINFHYGLCLFGMHRDDEALAQYRKTLDIDSSTGGMGSHWGIAQVYERRGQYDEAIRELDEARRLDPRPTWNITIPISTYALAGRRKEAQEALAQVLEIKKREYVSAFFIAQCYAALGDKDQAFVWLNRAIDEREIFVAYLKGISGSDSCISKLRDDPRFPLLLQRLGLNS